MLSIDPEFVGRLRANGFEPVADEMDYDDALDAVMQLAESDADSCYQIVRDSVRPNVYVPCRILEVSRGEAKKAAGTGT